jgi:hypothetical protein
MNGTNVGGLAVESIHAQTKPPAYYVVEIDAKNEDVFSKEWAPKADQTIKDSGGHRRAGAGACCDAVVGIPRDAAMRQGRKDWAGPADFMGLGTTDAVVGFHWRPRLSPPGSGEAR